MSRYLDRLIRKVEKEFIEVEKLYPRLQLFIEDQIYMQGDIDIRKENEFFGRFSIRIELSSYYPNDIPVTFEDKGKIPNDIDRHKFVENNSCCLVPTAQKRIILGRKYTLLNYIEKLVVPYFANQIFFELNKKFYREYSHGDKGVLEFYQDFFETKSINYLVNGLNCALSCLLYTSPSPRD